MAYAIMAGGRVLIDTVYDLPALSKIHYLAFMSGDYGREEFDLVPARLAS